MRGNSDSIASRVDSSSAGEGDSSTSFWCLRWIEHSRSPSVSTPPFWSQRTCTSTCLAGAMNFSR